MTRWTSPPPSGVTGLVVPAARKKNPNVQLCTGSSAFSFDRVFRRENDEEGKTLLWTIFVILLVLWLLGMVSSYTLGGYIHILLILAIAVVLIRVIQGRRPVV